MEFRQSGGKFREMTACTDWGFEHRRTLARLAAGSLFHLMVLLFFIYKVLESFLCNYIAIELAEN